MLALKRAVFPALLLPALLLAGSCSVRESAVEEIEMTQARPQTVIGAGLADEDLLREMNIKVTPEMAAVLEASTDADGYVVLPSVRSFSDLGIVRMRRLFPEAGRFEARTRAEGLHLWYLVSYDEGRQMTRAASELEIPGVEVIEYCPRMEQIGGTEATVCEAPAATRASSASMPFDDPRLPEQWHYYNDGKAPMSVSGCDINVFPVWRNYSTYAKVKSDIVVCVVDGGIDYNHEDLKDNMWHNPEKTGDNVYGYNFASSTFNIHPENHGTHVAGTIAAVNNNGVGVSGVAGGDAKKKIAGAKLMSCQIFDGSQQGSGAEAIKWGADHGAVISQNSWGYVNATTTPSSLKSAVDYFIKYAGVDESGKQTGPMKGGIVIFASGNENATVSGNDYSEILNVTALAADYKRSYFTNYGDWCDIAAPGGDAKKGNQVLSTLPGNKYGLMQGSSMACPHVSGVAALVLARYGADGYTSSALRKRLEDNVTDIAAQNANYYLGKGLVNAYRAIAGSGGKAPETPSGLKASAQSNNVHFSVTVPRDSDDGKPNSIYVYYSTSDFSNTSRAAFGMFYVEDIPVGGTLEGTITGLDFNQQYYLAAQACDLAGNKSGLTARITVTTGGNNAPVITTSTPLEYSLKPHESAVAQFSFSDPDGHFCAIDLQPESPALVLDTLDRDNPKVRITASAVPAGSYTSTLTVTDFYGAAASSTLRFTVLENHAPKKVADMEDMIFQSKAATTTELPVATYFADEDGEDLTYAFTFSDPLVANMTYSKGKFLLTPMNYGITEITVTGTDIRGEAVSQTFRVLVRESTKEVELYPNPVLTDLNIRTGEEADVQVKVVSGAGSLFFDGSLHVSPFTPARIDMKDAAPGAYTVSLTMGGKEYKSNIVKL